MMKYIILLDEIKQMENTIHDPGNMFIRLLSLQINWQYSLKAKNVIKII